MNPTILVTYLYVFGAVTMAGGVVGFVKAKSKASLVAGTISGALLVVAGFLHGSGSRAGVFLGLLVSLALAGRFGMAFKKSRKVMPAGLILALAVVGVVLSTLTLV